MVPSIPRYQSGNGIETLPNPSNRHIHTVKTTVLVDTDPCAPRMFSTRHTGLTTPKLAVKSLFVAPRNLRVSPAIRAMTTNCSGTPSVQRRPGPCFAIGCLLRTVTPTTLGWSVNYTASAGYYLFGHNASVRPNCPTSRMVPRVPWTRGDRHSLQPRTQVQTGIQTPPPDPTTRNVTNVLYWPTVIHNYWNNSPIVLQLRLKI